MAQTLTRREIVLARLHVRGQIIRRGEANLAWKDIHREGNQLASIVNSCFYHIVVKGNYTYFGNKLKVLL